MYKVNPDEEGGVYFNAKLIMIMYRVNPGEIGWVYCATI